MEKCSICGSTRGVFSHDYLVVNQFEESNRINSATIRRITTETLTGAEHHGICEECVKKDNIEQWKSNSFGIGGGVIVILGLILYLTKSVSLLVGALIVAASTTIVLLLTRYLYTRLSAVYRNQQSALKTYLELKRPSFLYVEVGECLYKSESDFLSKNRFASDLGKKLYYRMIASGSWREFLSDLSIAEAAKAEPRGTGETTPQNETDSLLQRSVQELLRLYRETPQGFLKDSPAAEPVRAIGRQLDEAGGFPLMLRAHEQFTAANPGYGLARNLEIVWDGIGGWRG